MPNCACACSAEMPFEWLASWWIASNHVRSGNLLRCMTVPAVTEVCRWQPEHSQVNGLVSSSQPLQTPQAGQTKPSGHRFAARLSQREEPSKLSSGKIELDLEPIDVTKVITEAVSIIAKKADSARVQIGIDIDVRCPRIEADRLRMRQVLLNLLTNAVKFTPAGGYVEVSASVGA